MAVASSVFVSLRIKPNVSGCGSEAGCVEVAESADGQHALVTVRGKGGNLHEFAFDTVFIDPACASSERKAPAVLPNTQKDVFNRVARPLCRAVLQGMHASILAYGQTGSGKTYTVLGPVDPDRQRKLEHWGLLPRHAATSPTKSAAHPTTTDSSSASAHKRSQEQEQEQQLDSESQQNDDDEEEQQEDEGRVLSWKMEVQFVEIYQERLFDLLAPPLQHQSSLSLYPQLSTSLTSSSNNSNNGGITPSLAVRYDKHGKGAHVAGAVRKEVSCLEEALEAFRVGLRARRTSETKLNAFSSRSHALFSLFVSQIKTDPVLEGDTTRVVKAQLHLVDLAGSERQKGTYAVGVRLREAGKINSSLSVLSQVVRELAEGGGSGGHVPYRDSKLTFLLMNSLGGNGKAAVIATLSQEQQHVAETRSSLAFAALSKSVRLRPVANQTLNLSHERVMALVRERAEMAAELKLLRALNQPDGGGSCEEFRDSSPNESSADLVQALIDATEAVEVAKAQLRAVLRLEPAPEVGTEAGEEISAARSDSDCSPIKDDELQENQRQTQRHLLQLMLRHAMYSPQLQKQLQEASIHVEAGGAEAFLRMQALLVRLLEIQHPRHRNLSSTLQAPLSTGNGPAVAAALASALEKAIPLMRTLFASRLYTKEQQSRTQEDAVTGHLFGHDQEDARGAQADKTESDSEASSTIMEAAPELSDTANGEEMTVAQMKKEPKNANSWEPQILAAAQLLERLLDAALVDTITDEEKLGCGSAALTRNVCDRAIVETLQQLVLHRGFSKLQKRHGASVTTFGTHKDSTDLAKLAHAEPIQEGQRWGHEQHPDSRLSTFASSGVSSSGAQEESLFQHSQQSEEEARQPAGSNSDNTALNPRVPSEKPSVNHEHPKSTAEAEALAVGTKNTEPVEARAPSTLDCASNCKELCDLLEQERCRNIALEERIAELERQLLICSLSNKVSKPDVKDNEEQHVMPLPLMFPLSAICDGQRTLKGPLVFCVHTEAGSPPYIGCSSYGGESYLSIWEEKELEEGVATVPLLDSVSFVNIKKVSRVLDCGKPQTSAASGTGESKQSEDEPEVGKGSGTIANLRFLYRLYFRCPVSILLGSDDSEEPTVVNWITVAMNGAGLSRWDINSPEDCDRLVLSAMRSGARN